MVELELSWDKELFWLQEQIDTWVWLHFHLCVRVFVIFIAESAVVDKPGSRWQAAFGVWNLVFSVRKTWDFGAIQEN